MIRSPDITTHPHQEGESKKRKEKTLKKDKAERGTMSHEERLRQRFRKDVGRNVRSRNPVCTKSAISNKTTNKMMTNINMFGT